MGFLTRYRELRQDVGDQHLDEIEYNFGRALHQIGMLITRRASLIQLNEYVGLLSHAVKHYERSLDIVNKKQEIDKNVSHVSTQSAF